MGLDLTKPIIDLVEFNKKIDRLQTKYNIKVTVIYNHHRLVPIFIINDKILLFPKFKTIETLVGYGY